MSCFHPRASSAIQVRSAFSTGSVHTVAARGSFGKWPTPVTGRKLFSTEPPKRYLSVSNVAELWRVPIPFLVHFECVSPFSYFLSTFSILLPHPSSVPEKRRFKFPSSVFATSVVLAYFRSSISFLFPNVRGNEEKHQSAN